MKLSIPTKLSRLVHTAGFKLKKHSPEILVGVGVVGVVTSAVLACKATTKVEAVLDKTKNDVDTIKHFVENPADFPEEYTPEDGKKDLAIVYTKTAVELVKLYAPAVILGTASLACIITSHRILTKRNAATAAALASVTKSFKEYRGNVIERFGEELDKELRFNIKAKEVEETIVNEKGEEETVTKTIQVANPNEYSDYARCFDDGCTGWSKDAEYNLMFLKRQQQYATDKLRAQGYLFLNDVYDMLGFQRSKAGQIVGWVYDEKNPIGDNYVDFGIYDINREKARDFVNGYERSIMLEFNVDGNILDLI